MSVWKRLVATLVGTCAVIGALSACDPYVPNVVGDTLPKAVERLENAGYKELAVVDDHGMSITALRGWLQGHGAGRSGQRCSHDTDDHPDGHEERDRRISVDSVRDAFRGVG